MSDDPRTTEPETFETMTLRQFLHALATNPAPEDAALSGPTLRAILADIRDVAKRLHAELQETSDI